MDDMRLIAHTLAIQMMAWDEPIPPFDTRFPGKLESCIEVPFHTFDGRDLYATLVEKAAILFYVMIKNHPFQNGNKRTAVTTLMTFLYINDHWLKATNEQIYRLATRVAETGADDKTDVVGALQTAIAANLSKLEDTPA